MGYYLLEPPELTTPRRPHCPEFEGPIVGLPAIQKAAPPELFHLRDTWIELFLGTLNADDGDVPREWAIAWLDRSGTFPMTAGQLISGINNPSEIQRAALACLDAWHAL